MCSTQTRSSSSSFFFLSLSALHVMRGELFSDSFFLLLSRFLAQFSPFKKFPPADCARTQHKMQDIYLLPHPRSMARLIGQLICSYCLKTRRANYFGSRLISPFPCRLCESRCIRALRCSVFFLQRKPLKNKTEWIKTGGV